MEYPSLSTPTAGSIRFNTDSTKMEIYNGDAWWVLDGTSAGEETATLECVIEPFLLQIGFLQRSPRGRIVTDAGRNHIELRRKNEE